MAISSLLERFTQTFVAQPFRELARKAGWLKRQGKIDAFEFMSSLSFGQMSASRPTLSSQSQSLAEPVSRQAIDQRYTPEALEYIKSSCAHVLAQILDWSPHHPQAEQLLAHFTGLYLLDSTSFDCASNLKEIFPSCGGDGTGANIKVLLRYELIAGQLEPLHVLEGKRSDQGQALKAAERLEKDQLQLQDKGFYDSKAWQAAQQRGAYLLVPLPHSVTLWKAAAPGAQEEEVDLAQALSASSEDQVQWPELYLGKKGHRAGLLRLVAFRLSPESAARHRQGLRKSMSTQGRTPTAKALELAGWLLLITNAPAKKLPSSVMSYVYRLRWQVELIFRQMKSVLRLDKSESGNPFRVQCEIWARLICASVLFLCHAHASAEYSRRHQCQSSFEKVFRIMQHWGLSLARALLEGPQKVMEILRIICKHIMIHGRKAHQNSRSTTWQNLVPWLTSNQSSG